MAMKRGGSPVKKRGGGMLKMRGGGSPMGAKKKMAGGGMMAKKKMAKGGVLEALKRLKKGAKPMTGRSAAAKKAMGKTKAMAMRKGKMMEGKGNPAGKDLSLRGRLGSLFGKAPGRKGKGPKKQDPMSALARRRLLSARAKKNTKGR